MLSPRSQPGVSLTFILAAAAAIAVASTKLNSAAPKRLPSVQELSDRGVHGLLGHPLGTIVTAEGHFLDGDTTRLKALSGVLLLVVERVDGKKLRSPIQLRFTSAAGVALPKGTDDAPFQLVGFETGGFVGLPSEAFEHIPAVATTEFHFEPSFTVLTNQKSN